MKKITIAFDIDGTIRSNTVDQTKAPVANEEIRSLLIILSKFKNVKILVWSGGGELYARQVASSLGLQEYVDGYADKKIISCSKADCQAPDEEHNHFGTELQPDIAIDDIQDCTLGKLNLIVKQK